MRPMKCLLDLQRRKPRVARGPFVSECWIIAPWWECTWLGLGPSTDSIDRLEDPERRFAMDLLRVPTEGLRYSWQAADWATPEQTAAMKAASWSYLVRETHFELRHFAEPSSERGLVRRLLALSDPKGPLVYNAYPPNAGGARITNPETGEFYDIYDPDHIPTSIVRGMGWDIDMNAMLAELGPWRPGLVTPTDDAESPT